MKKLIIHHPSLVLIILTGCILRFWGIWEMEYHHDELSALMRTRFGSLSELLTQGVMIDGHPAFTQVFLWVWTGLFGYEPSLVKLPFLLAGCASIWLVYLIGKTDFNNNTGLVSAAWFSVGQYAILYSQWTRPYAFGLLFMLCAFYGLVHYRKSSSRWDLLLFAVSASLAAYSHYFALLQLILLVVAWFVVKLTWRQRLEVFLASIAAFLLWLPHLEITLGHLEIGGIGDWLQPPPSDYWLDLIAYSFHFSWLWAFIIFSTTIVVIISTHRGNRPWKSVLALSLAWIFQYAIAFIYSVEISSLMHLGTMLFSFPVLIWSVAGVYKNASFYLSRVLVLAIIVLGLETYADRNHFNLNVHTEFQDSFHWLSDLRDESNTSIHSIFDLRPDAVDFLSEHELINSQRVDLCEEIDGKWQVGYFQNIPAEQVLFLSTAATAPEWRSEALYAFPVIDSTHNYNTASCELLSIGAFSQDVIKKQITLDIDLSEEEFGPDIYVDQFSPDSTFIVFRVFWDGRVQDEAQFVLEWNSNDDEELWRSVSLTDFQLGREIEEASIAIDIRDLKQIPSGGKLRAYLWNQGFDPILLRSMRVEFWPANPYRYGLFNDFRR